MFGFALFIAVVSAICFGAVSLGLLFRVDRMQESLDGVQYAMSRHARDISDLDYNNQVTTKRVENITDRLNDFEDRAGIERGIFGAVPGGGGGSGKEVGYSCPPPQFSPGDQHPFAPDAYVTANEVPF